MGGECSKYGDRRGVYRLMVGKPEERDHLKNQGVDGRIILKVFLPTTTTVTRIIKNVHKASLKLTFPVTPFQVNLILLAGFTTISKIKLHENMSTTSFF
jgi:hypothetical protein